MGPAHGDIAITGLGVVVLSACVTTLPLHYPGTGPPMPDFILNWHILMMAFCAFPTVAVTWGAPPCCLHVALLLVFLLLFLFLHFVAR